MCQSATGTADGMKKKEDFFKYANDSCSAFSLLQALISSFVEEGLGLHDPDRPAGRFAFFYIMDQD